MDLQSKLAVLADAAKYDASCASSGSSKKHSLGARGMGSTEGMGICHSYAPGARFSVEEVVQLTLDFYGRNYIEGLFLSSGVIRNADYTMEQLVRVARTLREQHDFRGYIHLKTIPDASPELLAEAGRYADRVSVNIELSSEASLTRLAPEKNDGTIRRSMAHLREHIDEAKADRAAPKFAPGG